MVSCLACVCIFLLISIFEVLQCLLNWSFLVSRDLVAKFSQLLLGLEDSSVSTVEFLNTLFLLLICLSISLCLCLHALDLVVAQAAGCFDTNLLLFASSFVLSSNVEDTVGINIKGYFDLWLATACRHDTIEVENTDLLVLCSHWALTLQYLNLYRRLVVHCCGKGLGLLGWDSGVGLNHLCHHATHSLDTEREWGNIEEEDILHITSQYTTLDSSTKSYNLVWVNTLRWSFAEEFLNCLLDSRDTS